MTVLIDGDKKDRIEKLIKSFREIDGAIIPFQDQRKDLRKSYIENQWLTKEEYDLVKKSYNLLKGKIDIEDLSIIYDVSKKEMK